MLLGLCLFFTSCDKNSVDGLFIVSIDIEYDLSAKTFLEDLKIHVEDNNPNQGC